MSAGARLEVLGEDSVPALVELLRGQSAEYLEYFYPFEFSETEFSRRIRGARRDRYWAIFDADALAGFCMLRGFDDGYEKPAFGVCVASEFAGRGLGREALGFCIDYCRSTGVKAIMLTVDPANVRAAKIYESAGFVRRGVKASTGQDYYELQLT